MPRGTLTIGEASTSNSNLNQRRVKKHPSYVNNYNTSNEDINSDEEMMNLAILGPYVNEDPQKYKDT